MYVAGKHLLTFNRIQLKVQSATIVRLRLTGMIGMNKNELRIYYLHFRGIYACTLLYFVS